MSTLQIFLKRIIMPVLFAGVLFGSAGRWDLPLVWAYLFVYLISHLVIALAIIKQDPGLAKERTRPGPGAKNWDRVWLTVYGFSCFAILIVAGLDIRFGWPGAVPLGVQIAALVGFAAAVGLVVWAMSANTFFSTVVRIQRDRGQYVITAGPYQYLRHPGYAGSALFWLCTGLALDSWWAMLPATLVALQYILRTALEDRTLHEELEGYAEYAERVRYRLLPGIW